MKKVVDSLQALALELGKDAYLRSQKSGERGAGLFHDSWGRVSARSRTATWARVVSLICPT